MSARLNRSNLYAGKCCVCGDVVPSQRGFLLAGTDSRDTKHHAKRFITVCSQKPCVVAVVGEAEIAAADKRELQADGTIVMPYDAKALPLLRSIAKWDHEAKVWRASLDFAERDHVLDVAKKLELAVDPSLVEVAEPERVRVAVERSRAAGGREYQIAGVRRLASTATWAPSAKQTFKGCLLGDDPGLGKTHQVLFSLGDDEALFVVCPKNAVAVWKREALKWRPDRFDAIHICEGGDSFRWPTSVRELVIINYEVLPRSPAQIQAEIDKLQKKVAAFDDTTSARTRKRGENDLARALARKPAGPPPCPVLLVADEAHYVQNNKAIRTVSFRRLADLVQRIYGLTGTPVESEPLLLWGMLTSLKCNPFSWTQFKEQFSAFDGAWGGIDFVRLPPEPGSTARGPVKVKEGTTEILKRVMLRRRKQDVLTELPPKVYSEIPVPIEPKLYEELSEIAAQYIDVILRGELPPFDVMAGVRKALALGTIPALLAEIETYESAEIPLIVFSAHRAPIEELGKREGWAIITGDTPAEQRGEIQDAFQRGDLRGVAGTIGAMATAMTLTRASTVLFVDRSWRQSDNDQAEDRAHRLGQRDSVHVVTFVPEHPLTRHVADILSAKRRFVDATLHGETDYTAAPSRFVDVEGEEWKRKVDAYAQAEVEREQARQRRELEARERELAKLASREVTPEIGEQRARARAQRLGEVALYKGAPAPDVQAALRFMLSVCDGAIELDGQGFNKPDSAVANWLAPAVEAGLEHAVWSTAAMLRRYPRQLAERWPDLFSDKSAT